MNGIHSAYLLQRSDDGILSLMLCVRDGDPHGRRHFSGSVAGAGRDGVLSELPMRAALQYSPTRRDDFVCDACLAGTRPKDLLVSSGYEAGLFGMEGRGLYAGGNVGGVYAQVAQNGGWSYGFQEQMYLAYGNNTSKEGADGKTGSVVSAELWLPTLGKYGHFAFGETYDVSPEGVRKAQEEWLKEQGLNVEYTEKGLKRLEMDMRRNGYVPVVTEKNTFFNQHNGDKITYHKDGLIWGNYGNVEVIENADGSGYSSYNYGNHSWTHLMIDYLGYRLRDY